MLASHTTKAAGARFITRTSGAGSVANADEPLTVNWVMQSPIAQNSGGYRNIFRIATQLGRAAIANGCTSSPIAHLERTLRARIEPSSSASSAFRSVRRWSSGCRGYRSRQRRVSSPRSGRPRSPWSHHQSLFKAYPVQDFEPEFYDESDPGSGAAEHSYRLPLRHICLGAHLAQRLQDFTGVPSDLVDFALDPCFTTTTPPEKRGTLCECSSSRGRVSAGAATTSAWKRCAESNCAGPTPRSSSSARRQRARRRSFRIHEPRRPRCARRRGCDELMPHPADVLADEHLERPIRGDGVQLRRRRCRPSERDGDGRAGAKLPRRRVRAGFARRCRDDLDRRSRSARTPRTAGCERHSPQDVATHGRHVEEALLRACFVRTGDYDVHAAT